MLVHFEGCESVFSPSACPYEQTKMQQSARVFLRLHVMFFPRRVAVERLSVRRVERGFRLTNPAINLGSINAGRPPEPQFLPVKSLHVASLFMASKFWRFKTSCIQLLNPFFGAAATSACVCVCVCVLMGSWNTGANKTHQMMELNV